MAKQAIDNKTIELVLPAVWRELVECDGMIYEIKAGMERMETRRNELYAEVERLKAAGVNWAGTTWRDGKYLILVYPFDDDGTRKREYIGADEKKIKEAMQKLDNGRALDNANGNIKMLESSMNSIRYALDGIKRRLI